MLEQFIKKLTPDELRKVIKRDFVDKLDKFLIKSIEVKFGTNDNLNLLIKGTHTP